MADRGWGRAVNAGLMLVPKIREMPLRVEELPGELVPALGCVPLLFPVPGRREDSDDLPFACSAEPDVLSRRVELLFPVGLVPA